MKPLSALLALTLLAASPAVAQAQAWQPRPGAAAIDPHRYQADQRAAFARQLELETRLNRQRLEAARLPDPAQPPQTRALRSPEEERALRLSATGHRRATTADVGQIDAWLDRGGD